MSILIISDIHGNLTALETVLAKAFEKEEVQKILFLGDFIDYGMCSNEVIAKLKDTGIETHSILGNHEELFLRKSYEGIRSEKSKIMMNYTWETLNDTSVEFIQSLPATLELEIGGKRVLMTHSLVHSSSQKGPLLQEYGQYDVVLSGHTHVPHYFMLFGETDTTFNMNKHGHRTEFVNPGSVGQPRDGKPNAHYVLCDESMDDFQFLSIPYDIEKEIKKFHSPVNNYYAERLRKGE